jgi:hypothetical protein
VFEGDTDRAAAPTLAWLTPSDDDPFVSVIVTVTGKVPEPL